MNLLANGTIADLLEEWLAKCRAPSPHQEFQGQLTCLRHLQPRWCAEAPANCGAFAAPLRLGEYLVQQTSIAWGPAMVDGQQIANKSGQLSLCQPHLATLWSTGQPMPGILLCQQGPTVFRCNPYSLYVFILVCLFRCDSLLIEGELHLNCYSPHRTYAGIPVA